MEGDQAAELAIDRRAAQAEHATQLPPMRLSVGPDQEVPQNLHGGGAYAQRFQGIA